jgi:hypothetical protein
MPRHDYIPLKHVLPREMTAKNARVILRGQSKFKQRDGRWEFPAKTADKVEKFLEDQSAR